METAAFNQNRHGCDRIELRGGREIEPGRIAPGTAHEIVEKKVRHIHQHQAGKNLAGAKPDLADRRYQGIERPRRRAEQQHRGHHPMSGVGALRFHGEPAAGDGADQKLSFGSDVPDVGEITERQTDRDHHQRCRLHRNFLQRITVGQGIDEIDAKRGDRILAENRKQDAHGHDRQTDCDQRRNQRDRVRPLGALFKHQLHGPVPSAPDCFRP